MGNSSLASDYKLNQCISKTAGRNGYKLDKIIIHHMAMTDWSPLPLMWNNTQTSAHYGINSKGEIRQYITEDYGTWNCGDWDGNMTSIAIEHENISTEPNWDIAQATIDASAKLCADIAKRNNFGRLVPYQNLFPHDHFSATQCPGQLKAKLQYIADQANKINSGQAPGESVPDNPIPEPEQPDPDKELEDLFNKILEDKLLTRTTLEQCYSLLGYLSNSNYYNFPIWMFKR